MRSRCRNNSPQGALHIWEGAWAGTHALTVSSFLSEDLYLKTRLQFDETAKHLQNLETATRKAVCTTVKEFNMNQVYTPGLSGGEGGHTATSLSVPAFSAHQ